MYCIGLTGGIGAGKSAVGDVFSSLGITVVDADEIAREITASGSDLNLALGEHFGTNFIDQNGELKRRELRDYIFDHPYERAWLEAKLHPPIRARLYERCQQAISPYCIAVIPLLKSRQTFPWLRRILVVDVSETIQKVRASERDASIQDRIEQIMMSQLSREERLKLADDVIDNNGSMNDLQKKVNVYYKTYLNLAETVS